MQETRRKGRQDSELSITYRWKPLLLTGSLLLLVGGARAGGQLFGFMTPAGPVAAAQRYHLILVTIISMVVVLPVILGVPWLAWRYRYSNKKARYTPHWDFSHVLEAVMWVVPAIIVAVLGVMLWNATHKLDPYRPIGANDPPLEIQAIGLNWKWLFIYPEYHIATVGQMAFPRDRQVALSLTSDTVMQSFMIPALVGQVYTMAGMTTRLHLKANNDGTFDGFNTQYNGAGFHDQHFKATAMSHAGFAKWVKTVQADGVRLDRTLYANRLAIDSTPSQVHAAFADAPMPAGVTYFNDVAPGFFARVLSRYNDGKAIPAVEQPGSVAYNNAHRQGH